MQVKARRAYWRVVACVRHNVCALPCVLQSCSDGKCCWSGQGYVTVGFFQTVLPAYAVFATLAGLATSVGQVWPRVRTVLPCMCAHGRAPFWACYLSLAGRPALHAAAWHACSCAGPAGSFLSQDGVVSVDAANTAAQGCSVPRLEPVCILSQRAARALAGMQSRVLMIKRVVCIP